MIDRVVVNAGPLVALTLTSAAADESLDMYMDFLQTR